MQLNNILINLVSVRLVEAENLDWRLFQVSDRRFIEWFGKSCRIFKLSLHLKLHLAYLPNFFPFEPEY